MSFVCLFILSVCSIYLSICRSFILSIYLSHLCVYVCFLQLLSAMVAKLGNREDPLPQELYEGVDEDEWVSKELTPQTYTHQMIHDTL